MRLSEEATDSMSVEKKETGIDPLTGLKDRSVLPYLNRQFSMREHPWSLVIIDIDHFKLVNDIYGHLTGDEILSQVGQTIKVNLKSNDFALRFGGDEFIVILPDTSGNSALDLAQRLLFEFRKREFPGGPKISVSIGIAQSKAADHEVSDLISMADQALYHAKETGRGRFVLADDLKFVRDAEPDFSHMVGRRDELQQLRELVDRAAGDSARFCLLTGFQGTGKTKLVKELFNYCQFKNMPVFTIEAHPVFQEENFLILSTVDAPDKSSTHQKSI
ncbi:MAG: diguanylate cyclase [Candidatus Sabulitectum sp.]|nr:diguanylate cyclase [Candidatus Sabulitectum sp.]